MTKAQGRKLSRLLLIENALFLLSKKRLKKNQKIVVSQLQFEITEEIHNYRARLGLFESPEQKLRRLLRNLTTAEMLEVAQRLREIK